ncbi:MAG: hypothetical protein K1X89_03340 [Myxococcaceae bacterium]|nr:hypothetical protein [Myxococcaceae bacterium]
MRSLLEPAPPFRRGTHVWLARAVAAGCGLLALPFAPGESSAYPYDRLAFHTLAFGLAALGAWLLAASFVGGGQPFFARLWARVGLAAAALCLVCSLIMRVDWYAGHPSCCFLDDVALALIPVLNVSGLGLGGLTLLALARWAGTRPHRHWLALVLASVMILVGHLVRLVDVVTLSTYESASATLRTACDDPLSERLARPGCTEDSP